MSSAVSYELLMNTEFVQRLHDQLRSARDRILIQVMTFDGDAAGLGVADLLIAAADRGVDVQLTVDSFALRYVSDVRSTKPEVAEEVAATHAMFDRLERSGVGVVYVNPFGPINLYGLARNHKKIYVIDDAAYIGGINISDHNFEWLDFNIGFRDPQMVETLVDDFAKTRRGERQSLNGTIITNEHVEATFLDLLRDAKESIVVASPYALDATLVKRLRDAPAPRKTIVAPEESNFQLFRLSDPYIRKRFDDAGVELRSYANFFHAKFALIDRNKLMVGSSNFGLHSFRCNQEIAVVIEDPNFISAFTAILDQTNAHQVATTPLRYVIGAMAATIVQTATIASHKIVNPYAPTLTTR